MDIANFVLIAQNYIVSQGVPENTVKDTRTETELGTLIRKAMIKFFAFSASPKIAGFFFETGGLFGSDKTVNEKHPLAHGAAGYWLYKFYTDAVPSNRSSVRKKSNNSENVSVFPDKMQAAEDAIQVHASNRLICDYVFPKFATHGEVTASGVLKFDTIQLLSAGDTVEINGIQCLIDTEDVEGLDYTFTEPLPISIGPASVRYTIDTTGWQNWPRMSAASMLNF